MAALLLTAACSAEVGESLELDDVPTTTEEQALVGQGALQAQNPSLAYDPARKAWLSFADKKQVPSTYGRACDGTASVWSKGFAHVPYRIGPTPQQLGDCWEGDALPNGPAAWAVHASTAVSSPHVARIGAQWFLTYAATTAGGQQCIGLARGSSPTGPSWTHDARLECPSNTQLSARDPELFYDTQTAKWFLLWTEENASACSSRLLLQEFNPSTRTFALGSARRELLSSSHAALGFSAVANASGCPSGVRRRIESPTMIRGRDGNLWLLFSANERASVNYATGWALCGSGSPAQAGACVLASSLDAQGQYRPHWGFSGRTAAASGVNAKPYMAYPDLPGFGGLSVAVAEPTSSSPQPVYVAAQMHYATRTQLTLRLDTNPPGPGLFEPDAVTWHGGSGTFPTNLGSVTPSGQQLSTRVVPGFSMVPGVTPLFNAVSADGTYFSSGLSKWSSNESPSADVTHVGVFDPKRSEWTNLVVTTMDGRTELPARNGMNAGGFISDVEAVDDGKAVAFAVSFPYPIAYMGNPSAQPPVPPALPAGGQWPELGIVAKDPADGNRWKVVAKWTGAQLAASNPPVSERACPSPPNAGLVPEGVRGCNVVNEIAVLPASKHAVITQFSSNPGVMVVSYKNEQGAYVPKVMGHFAMPPIPNYKTPDPNDTLLLLPKEVQTDPTGERGDERFFITFDAANDDQEHASVILELSYNANAGPNENAIKPSSAPIITAHSRLGMGRYDRDGNLWAYGPGGRLVMYEKRPTNACPQSSIACRRKISNPAPVSQGGCAFDANNTSLAYQTNGSYGQLCPPDYEFLQARMLPSAYNFSEHPEQPIMMMLDIGGFDDDANGGSDPAQQLAFRYTRDPATQKLVFEVGQVANTSLGRFLAGSRPGTLGVWKDLRPGSFDRTGRFWFVARSILNGYPEDVSYPHWVGAVDVKQLFDESPPVVLASAQNGSTTLQAEYHATHSTRTFADPTCPAGSASCTMVVDPTALVQYGTQGVGVGLGTELVAESAGVGHRAGKVKYKTWVPRAGRYRVAYRVRGGAGASIKLQVDDTSGSTDCSIVGVGASETAVSSASWSTVQGPEIELAQGQHTLHLCHGGAGYRLDWLTLTRTSP